MLSPKPKSLLDTMATQTRSNLSIPDPPVISLPGRSTKTTSKPASVSVPVETISSEGTDASATASIEALALVGDSGETVPASLEVAQVDITEVTNNDTKSSVDNKNTKFSFASLHDSCLTTSSATPEDDKKPSFDDSASINDKSNNKKNSLKKSGNDDSNCDDKKNNKKNNDTSSPAPLPILSTLFCTFVFKDPTRTSCLS